MQRAGEHRPKPPICSARPVPDQVPHKQESRSSSDRVDCHGLSVTERPSRLSESGTVCMACWDWASVAGPALALEGQREGSMGRRLLVGRRGFVGGGLIAFFVGPQAFALQLEGACTFD